ncbi:MAG: trypsin-like peptidase domain-containing protein, partial [Eubacteriales bacterium]|nr:trypsin-like peptidase domain-containing protein [Eubacteriales bacterium]
KSVRVIMANEETVPAEIIGMDAKSDVAVLKIEKKGLTVLKLGDSDSIRAGEYVLAIGTPASQNLAGTVTMGIISATKRSINVDGKTNNYIQTDAAINFGNSGGPLLSMSGEVVGINTAKTVTLGYNEYGQPMNAEGLGFALPINDVYQVAQTLLTKGYVERPALGVQVVTISGLEAKAFGITGEYGVIIDSIVKNGPAEKAGLLPNDVILTCEGQEVTDQDMLIALVDGKQVGDTIQLTVLRDAEKTIEITITMGDMNQMDYTDLIYAEEDERNNE